MKRKQFTFYRSFLEAIENLPTNKEKLQAYRMLCDYALNETEPELRSQKPSAVTVFQMAKPILERAHERAKRVLTENKLSPEQETKDADKIEKKEKEKDIDIESGLEKDKE